MRQFTLAVFPLPAGLGAPIAFRKKYASLLFWRSTPQQSSTVHRVRDRKLGAKRKIKHPGIWQNKRSIFRAIIFNRSYVLWGSSQSFYEERLVIEVQSHAIIYDVSRPFEKDNRKKKGIGMDSDFSRRRSEWLVAEIIQINACSVFFIYITTTR